MPEFIITAPDGNQYRVKGPEGSTEEQAMEKVKAQINAGTIEPESFDFSTKETLKNVPGDAARVVTDIGKSLVNPET